MCDCSFLRADSLCSKCTGSNSHKCQRKAQTGLQLHTFLFDCSSHTPAELPAESSPAPPAGWRLWCPVLLLDLQKPSDPPAPPKSLTDMWKTQTKLINWVQLDRCDSGICNFHIECICQKQLKHILFPYCDIFPGKTGQWMRKDVEQDLILPNGKWLDWKVSLTGV